MFEITKVYRQNTDPLRFIGKKYDNASRVNGDFDEKSKWKEWHQNRWFDAIEKLISKDSDDAHADGNAHIGLLRNKSGEPFQYWIGMFAPEGAPIPEGYDFIDFPKCELGVCWVYGKEDYVCMNGGLEILNKCNETLRKQGMSHVHDKHNTCWAVERYVSPRSTSPDEKGNIVLDICLFLHFDY